jgi:PelA/Pel-15E family pectate lyase
MRFLLPVVVMIVSVLPQGLFAQPPSRERVQQAMRKAVEFYRTKVSTQGGYHFTYTDDLSYGRSEQSEGPTQVEVQRQGTPIVGMTYLNAYEATGDRYYLDAAVETANALVRGQYCSGGWDYVIEFDPAKRQQYPYRADGACSGPAAESRRVTTLDDNVTQAATRLLMRVDRELKFQDAKIHEAARFALDSLSKAQYPNGAWPQRYNRFPDPANFPVKRASYPESWPRTWPGSNYQGHYTFNDNSIVDAIDMMLEASRIYDEPRYLASAEKGGEFMLMAQMPDPQPGWAQQYDQDMHPSWARRFEPPSVTGGESQSVMQMLLILYRETGKKKYLEPLPRAIDYYRRSILPDTDKPSEHRARACPPGSVCMARFYELKTNRPLYITKGTRAGVRGQPEQTVDGYEVSYSDESVITHYGVLTNGNRFKTIEAEYERLVKADPSQLKRPNRLRGLSPWTDGSNPVGAGEASPRRRRASSADPATRVAAILAGMDERGAWVEDGSIGRANRLVNLFVARPMVLTIGSQVIHLKENDTVQVFPGDDEPRRRVIRSQTFADNVDALGAYVAAARR